MQPRLQINLVKISTIEGHQILQPVLKIKYNKHKTKVSTNILFFTFLHPLMGPT